MNSTVPNAPAAPLEPTGPSVEKVIPPKTKSHPLVKTVQLVLKLGVVVGALYYLRSKVGPADLEKLKVLFSNHALMAGAIAIFSVQMLIGAQRLRILLAPQHVHLSYWTALRLTYLGAFFDTFMVTSVGGDAVKAFYLAREAPREHRVEAVSVLILDRLMGLIGLIALAVIVSFWQLQRLQGSDQTQWMVKWLIIVPFALLAGTAMLLSETVYLSSPMQFLIRYLPMGAMLGRAYGSLQKFRDRPRVLLHAFLLSTVVHTFGVLTGYVLMLGMDKHAEVGPFVVSLLVCNFVCSFLPLGGIGGGQVLFERVFLAIAAMEGGLVLATGLQVAILIAKAPGFIAWLLSREAPHHPADPAKPVEAVKPS